MNRYGTFMLLTFFLIVITLITQSAYADTTMTDITGGIVAEQTATIGSVLGMMSGLWKILTFQIPEIPLLLTMMVFYPLSFGVLFMVVDIVKHLIPFT